MQSVGDLRQVPAVPGAHLRVVFPEAHERLLLRGRVVQRPRCVDQPFDQLGLLHQVPTQLLAPLLERREQHRHPAVQCVVERVLEEHLHRPRHRRRPHDGQLGHRLGRSEQARQQIDDLQPQLPHGRLDLPVGRWQTAHRDRQSRLGRILGRILGRSHLQQVDEPLERLVLTQTPHRLLPQHVVDIRHREPPHRRIHRQRFQQRQAHIQRMTRRRTAVFRQRRIHQLLHEDLVRHRLCQLRRRAPRDRREHLGRIRLPLRWRIIPQTLHEQL